ncbi:hypothetical protein GCM10008968_06750 [Bacillus horti]
MSKLFFMGNVKKVKVTYEEEQKEAEGEIQILFLLYHIRMISRIKQLASEENQKGAE